MSEIELTSAEQGRLDQFIRALASALGAIKNKDVQAVYIPVIQAAPEAEAPFTYLDPPQKSRIRRQDGPARQRQAFSSAGIPA